MFAVTLFLLAMSQSNNVNYNNVVVVLDASGSMGEYMEHNKTKMDVAKESLKSVLSDVPDDTQIGIVCFGSSIDWVYPLASKDVGRLSAAIDDISPSGNTPLGTYIKKGADALLSQRKKQLGYGTYRLLVVTDGEAGFTERPLIDKYVPEIMSRGIVLDVIGLAMKSDHTLAKKCHSYRRGNDQTELRQSMQEVFAEVGNAGSDLDADLELIEPIPAELMKPIISAIGTMNNYPIGETPALSSLESNNTSVVKTVLITFTVAVGCGGLAILAICILRNY